MRHNINTAQNAANYFILYVNKNVTSEESP